MILIQTFAFCIFSTSLVVFAVSSPVPKCNETFLKEEYELVPDGRVRITKANLTLQPGDFEVGNGVLCIVTNSTGISEERQELTPPCKSWEYEPDEFVILENGSALTVFDEIFDIGSYEIRHEANQVRLTVCIPEEQLNETQVSDNNNGFHAGEGGFNEIILTQVGLILSVLALTVHLSIFVMLKSMRNFPSYNLTSLSVAFWFAYFFMLVGQIPEVLGVSCVVSATLVYYFFFAAFLWMNVLSFDIWYTLSRATYKLCFVSKKTKRKMFVAYSIYSWVFPLAPVITAVVADNLNSFPKTYRPGFGDEDLCFFTTEGGKKVFLMIPLLILILINCVFFAMCTAIIIRNSIATNSEQQSTARTDFLLYVRLGIIMGLTWLIGVVGVFTENEIVWTVFVILNTLQGVFVFVLFSCKRKVLQQLKQRFNFNVGPNSATYNLTSSSS